MKSLQLYINAPRRLIYSNPYFFKEKNEKESFNMLVLLHLKIAINEVKNNGRDKRVIKVLTKYMQTRLSLFN